MSKSPLPSRIAALLPKESGHHFVFYGDACSGVPGLPHETTFAATNAVISRLHPQPQFIVFPGDEIRGLTADEQELRAQWSYWFDNEMAWLDREKTQLYHSTSNHTTYDEMSERVFTEVLGHLPRNGPADQQGLSYFVRRDDLLIVFVHTGWSAIGGEGHVETDWLQETLSTHSDACFKLVVGHHPVYPVNGYSGEYQREIGVEHAARFWDILVEHNVLAYLCSHILAFDVQVHRGVLQLLSAGAGTAHRMPEEVEYLHCVQAKLDDGEFRYQVLDQSGAIRERLSWPFSLPPQDDWTALINGKRYQSQEVGVHGDHENSVVAWRARGRTCHDHAGAHQTFLSAHNDDKSLAPFWLGLTGSSQQVTVMISPTPGRSPHYWFGPKLGKGQNFDLQIAIHPDMGPGGVLWRKQDDGAWSSFQSATPWGAERLKWPDSWYVSSGQAGIGDRPFTGSALQITSCRG
ncbi:MAG: hypothetical protein GKR90_02545 [Pseudomonadales bacterium]|nr:hypothetical protein [Pseudomonadales bacterium]